MVKVERIRYQDGGGIAIMDLQVSTAAELPALNSKIGRYTVDSGSIAQIIQTGDFVTLDEDGTWYPEQS